MNPIQPVIYRLPADTVRLLLSGLGFHGLYGYLPEQPAGRQRSIACIAALLRQGLAENTGTHLALDAALRDCLLCMARAKRVFRVQRPPFPQPDCCLYPCGARVLMVNRLPVQPGKPPLLRLHLLAFEALWATLQDENPVLEPPAFPFPFEGTGPLPDPLPPPGAQPLPGEQFRITVHSADGLFLCFLAVVRTESRLLLYRSNGNLLEAQPCLPESVPAFLEEWKEPPHDFG